MANNRHDPDWADHAREDWIYERMVEKEKNDLQKKERLSHRCLHNSESAGISSEESELLTGRIADSL